MGRGVLPKHRLVLFKLLPGDVRRMRVRHQRDPLLPWALAILPIHFTLVRPSVDKRPGVARMMQGPERAGMVERAPDGLAFPWSVPVPPRKRPALLAEALHRRGRRAGAAEGLEKDAHRVLDLLVGIEHDASGRVVHEADR